MNLAPAESKMSAFASGGGGQRRASRSTLFDYLAPGMTNLKMGAPGEPTLKKCADMLKKAAIHRMVGSW